MQKLQITKITAPAALDLCYNWDFFYSAHVSLCSVCCVYESDCNINHLLIAFYHRWKLLRFFFLALMHKKRALPPPWLRKWFKRATEREEEELQVVSHSTPPHDATRQYVNCNLIVARGGCFTTLNYSQKQCQMQPCSNDDDTIAYHCKT